VTFSATSVNTSLGVTVNTSSSFVAESSFSTAKLASNELVPGGAGAVGAGESAVGTVGAGEFTATDDVVVVSTLASAK
jgi:hypothetical protein